MYSTKKKLMLSCMLFTIIFLALTIIATFFDYDISCILAAPFLKDGNYYSTNNFARIFEAIGECPIYLFLAFSASSIGLYLFHNHHKWPRYILLLLFFSLSCYASYFLFEKTGSYLTNYYDALYFLKKAIFMPYYIMIALVFSILLMILIHVKLKKYLPQLLFFSLIIIGTALLSQIIVQGIKPIFGRERFRSIYYYSYYSLPHPGFNKWFVILGNSKELASLYNAPSSDYFRSFPSGHTASAAITYTLLALPELFPINSKKQKCFLYIISLLYTGTVAISRIVMGAHYMSDVLFGGTITYVSFLLVKFLILKIRNVYFSKSQISNKNN